MTTTIALTLRARVEQVIEADSITPDRLATLSESEIAALPLWEGRIQRQLGELFEVRGSRSTSIRLTGDLSRIDALGAGMTTGELVIDGPVGRYVGTRMAGGTLRVLGNAGDGAGLEMAGGVLEITGNAGDGVGAARLGASKGMRGGEIVVRGSAGARAGARMRRGTIVVCGHTGPDAGEGMIAGNLFVLGAVGENAGRSNKRGSIVALGPVSIPVSYRYACTYRPPHVALALRSLRTRYAVPVTDAHLTGRYRRFSGDMAELGRGEILAWDGDGTEVTG
ncbi:MAG: formylmethanofuran dehydrogenase subunit C [Gemmatimonadaceae bacterium]|nr:formylmethanofuran dehydrogenase subunit C [Gemmatimonadaceae bacterium]